MKKLVSTLNLSRDEWLRYRKRGIGGSDAGAVCGLNPYSSAMKVYLDKTSSDISEADNEAMRQGRDLEDYVARRFTEETGLKVRRANGLFYDEEYPFMIADADRLIVGENAGLECKTVSPYSADKWEEGSIPLHYQIQCFHYMAVFRMQEWYIAALIFGKGFVVHKLVWDEDLIQNLRKIEKDFWENNVLAHVLPAPDGTDISDKLIAETFGKADTGSEIILSGFADKIKRRNELNELISRMDTEKREIEQELKIYLGSAERAEGEGYQVTWKNISSNKVDTERLKREKPDIYQTYLKETSYRRLTIKAA